MTTEHDAEEVLEESLALDSAYTTLLTPGEAAAAMPSCSARSISTPRDSAASSVTRTATSCTCA